MASDQSELIARLRSTVRDLLALTSGAAPKAMARRPAPGDWSAGMVVSHLADAELVYGFRLRLILTADEPTIVAYDESTWADRFSGVEEDRRDTLTRWRSLREANLRLLEDLAAPEWERAGLHAERGRETVAAMVEIMANHDRDHLDQIRTCLAG